MKCIVCKGEDILKTNIKEELKVGNDIIFVPINIPVCSSCGEKYYDRKTIKYLESEEQRLREGKVNLNEVGKVLEYA